MLASHATAEPSQGVSPMLGHAQKMRSYPVPVTYLLQILHLSTDPNLTAADALLEMLSNCCEPSSREYACGAREGWKQPITVHFAFYLDTTK